jgi:hypothetical protein
MNEASFCPTAKQLKRLPSVYYLPNGAATTLEKTPIAFLHCPPGVIARIAIPSRQAWPVDRK